MMCLQTTSAFLSVDQRHSGDVSLSEIRDISDGRVVQYSGKSNAVEFDGAILILGISVWAQLTGTVPRPGLM